MRKLKRPLLKNLFETIKSAFDSKKVDALPKALFSDKDENKIKKDLAKNVFKKNGKDFEDELKGFFEFITSKQMSFGASFYAKSSRIHGCFSTYFFARSAAMIFFMASIPTLIAPEVSSVIFMNRPAFSRS